MKMAWQCCFVLFAVSLLVNCVQRALEDDAKEPHAIYARETIDELSSHKFGPVRRRMVDETKVADEVLWRAADTYPKDTPTEIKLVRHHTYHHDGNQDYTLVFDSRYGDRHVFTTIQVVSIAGDLRVKGLNVRSAPSAPTGPVKWTVLHYLFVFLSCADVAIVIAALVRWSRTRRTIHRPWLWLVGILLCGWGVTFNWTTGEIQPLNFGNIFFGSTYQKDLLGYAMLTVSIPVGAIVFLSGRLTRRTTTEAIPRAAP